MSESLFTSKYHIDLRDVDFKKELKWSALFSYFQEIASLAASDLGLGIDTLQKGNGLAWVLTKIRVDVDRLPSWGEEIIIETWPLEPGKLNFDRDYIVRDQDGKSIIRAISSWVIIDLKERKLKRSKSIPFSLFISLVSVTIIILFSSMAGYALARNKSKISNGLFMVFVAAMLIPFQSVMIPLISLFGKVDMLNPGGLIFMYLGFGCSLSIFLYHGAMASIPASLDEAATIDGANKWQIFWKIIFPMLKSISVTVMILNIIWIWNDYLLPSLVLSAENATIPLNMFFFFGQYTKQWHLALAGLTLAIIPIIIVYFFAQKQIIKGVTDGAVK
ncbi:acyl-ACP thioesterase domain-containing protein [Oceanobacillus caeni]|uniref:acyl-ACP thioesterase domain-containing protein n=1 Tax=Oceanobacillus caeni TaxID=405946 RepID=UPI002E201E16|nr:thioesterase [Oceanobacillus caeni]